MCHIHKIKAKRIIKDSGKKKGYKEINMTTYTKEAGILWKGTVSV